MADGRHSGHPGGLTEAETLARLSVGEKRRIAEQAIKEFPHLSEGMVAGWLDGYNCEAEVSATAGVLELVDVLLDCLERKAESGEEPEALDHFIYGCLHSRSLASAGIDPNEFAEREPRDEWEGVYDG